MARHRSRFAQRQRARARDPVRLSTLRTARSGHDRQRDYLSQSHGRARNGQGDGFDEDTLKRISAAVATWEFKDENDALDRRLRDAGLDLKHPRIRKYFELCLAAQDLPRHLGQHSGGMSSARASRFGRAAGARFHARPSGSAVGQRRLCRHGHHQSRSAGSRHDGSAERFS